MIDSIAIGAANLYCSIPISEIDAKVDKATAKRKKLSGCTKEPTMNLPRYNKRLCLYHNFLLFKKFQSAKPYY